MLDHNYLYYKPIEQNDVILILGATHGDFIREYRNEILQKNAFVINVEPTLEGVISLANYIKHNMTENACVLSSAVSNFEHFITMDIRDNLITSTLDDRPETNNRWPMNLLYKQKAPALDLDTIIRMADYKINKLFMDIEGSELEVILDSILIYEIPYIAVAAYHIRDNEPTYLRLKSHLEGDYEIVVTDEPSRNKGEVVLFAMKDK